MNASNIENYHRSQREASSFMNVIFGSATDSQNEIIVFTLPDRRSRAFKEVVEAANYAAQRAYAGQNVYFGLALMKDVPDGKRGVYENTAGICALWCDIDIAGDTHREVTKFGSKPLPQSEEDALELIRRTGMQPSIIVHSGGGLHAYWLLREPWLFVDEAERRRAKQLAWRWGETIRAIGRNMGLAIDNLCDLTRVLRIPGTFNQKTMPPKPVVIRVPTPDVADAAIPRYIADDFESHLAEIEEIPASTSKPPSASAFDSDGLIFDRMAIAPPEKLEALKANNEKFSRSWEMLRPDLCDQSASGYEMSLVRWAAAAGWANQELLNLCIHWRRLHNQTPDKPFRRGYIQNLIAKARTPLNRERTEMKIRTSMGMRGREVFDGF